MQRIYYIDKQKNSKDEIIEALEQNDLYPYTDEEFPYEAVPTFSIFMDTKDNDVEKDNNYIEVCVREAGFGIKDIVICTKEESQEELYNRLFEKKFYEAEQEISDNFRDASMEVADFTSTIIGYKGKKLYPRIVMLGTGDVFSVVEYSERRSKVAKEDYMLYLQKIKVLEFENKKVLNRFQVLEVFDTYSTMADSLDDDELEKLGLTEPPSKTDKLDMSMELLDAKQITTDNPYIQILKRLQESNKKVTEPEMM